MTVERFLEWENGNDAPTVAQLRSLASKYHFPLAVFYLPEPPADFAPLRDFRRLPDYRDETISPNLAFHIRAADERRELALELNVDLNTLAPSFPLKATLKDDPEMVGEAIRIFLGVDDQSQRTAAQQSRAFDFWRRKLEEHSVLVFVISGPHYSIPVDEMRGFAIAKSELPVIVVNGRDHSQGGKTFTLVHELVHIILGESALSNGSANDLGASPEEQKIERFCDAVAAAALMPARLLSSFSQFARAGIRAWTLDELRPIANAIGVSRHALLLRFVSLRRTTRDFYKFQQPRFREEAHIAAKRSKARGPH